MSLSPVLHYLNNPTLELFILASSLTGIIHPLIRVNTLISSQPVDQHDFCPLTLKLV